MICFLYWLSKRLNTYFLAFTLFLSLVGGILAIAFAILIRDERSVLVFSSYLKKDIDDVVMIAGLSAGIIVIVSSFGGILFLTPFQQKWMYFIYSPLMLLSFGVLIALGIYIQECGNIAATLITDYCGDKFERWTKLELGKFPSQLDNHYNELEKNLLCSQNCQCPQINFNLWTTNPATMDNQNIRIDYNKKKFMGINVNVLKCIDQYRYKMVFDYKILDYLTVMEANYDCAGICDPVYFYTFTDVQLGPPLKSCKSAIINDYQGNNGVFRSLVYVFWALFQN
eukprot:403334233